MSVNPKIPLFAFTALIFLFAPFSEEPTASGELFQSPTDCKSCDFIVWEYETNGSELGIKPGDVICLSAFKNYNRLLFTHIVGTEEKPVIIRNCGGTAKVYSKAGFGIKFENSKHFKVLGDGGHDKFGIRISTEKGFFLTMEKFSSNFEIARVEIAGPVENGLGNESGFAGIGVKTSPYQDCELFADSTRTAWVMRDVRIHHNYIHDTGGEGLYIGHGFYKGRKEKQCDSVTYSHSIKGVRIHNNLIENIGYDGIQIKNADEDVAVYGNVIRNYGTKNNGPHNEGLFIGEGTTGKFYENLVDTGTGNGCQIQGMGNLDITNNVFINSGENGIYAAHGSQVIRVKGGYFNISDNTIYNSAKAGFVFYNNDGGPKIFANNKVVLAGTLNKKGAVVEMKDNLFTNEAGKVADIQKAIELIRLGATVNGQAPLK